MNDKRIISAISKIYFIIVAFLFLLFFLFSSLFILLQNGLYIENVSLTNIQAKQLYIKWNESVNVSIKEVKITDDGKASQNFNAQQLYGFLSKIDNFYDIFEEIDIHKLTYKDFTSSFRYERDQGGSLKLSSPNVSGQATLQFSSELLHIKIDTLNDEKRDIKINGDIVINTTEQSISSAIKSNVHNEVLTDIFLFTANDKLFYKITPTQDIKTIDYLMNLFNLHEDVRYWANDAIDFSVLSIEKFHGWIDLNNIESLYKNIYVSAIGKDLTYAYNPNLDLIHTKKTDLLFKDGVLFIYPRDAYTYKSKLDRSWLKIDFTKKEELLTLQLLFDGKLDKDTLNVLKEYEIDVPFLQNSGITSTKLQIEVGLRNIDVNAKGEFFTKKANFRYRGYDIDIFNARIFLDNYKVSIPKMLGKYKNSITTDISAAYNAQYKAGLINFNVKKLHIKEFDTTLNTRLNPLQAKYTISPQGDTIRIDSSLWKSNGHNVKVAGATIPLNIDTLKLTIPPTTVTSKDIAKASIFGNVDLKKSVFDLNANISKLYFGDINLTNPHIPLKLKYDKSLKITTPSKVNFTFYDEKSFINKINAEIKDDEFVLEEFYCNLGDIFKTKISAQYSLKNKKGLLQTRRTRITTDSLGLLYFNKDKTKFDIEVKDDEILVDSNIGVSLARTEQRWKLRVDSLASLSINSHFLKKHHLRKGYIYFTKQSESNDIVVASVINYPHKVMVNNNNEIERYKIYGKIASDTKKTSLRVNKKVDINIDKKITITMRNIGVNVNAILDIANSFEDASDDSSKLDISIKADNSYLYISKDRHIISDEIFMYYNKDILTAGLLYKDGVSGLKYQNKAFDIYGDNFNAEFMENLFSLSRFKGGNFNFTISGTTTKYDGLFTINDTTVIDYKVLNNVLAFVNTIPSLITFSTPGYSSEGLYVNHSYMKFTAQDDLFTISDMYLHSQELDITGKGKASFKFNTVDMELNLKTDVGSSVSKIPLVGYLLLDGDTISTSLKIDGALHNPSITLQTAKDIAVAPLNILLRAITLPYYLIDSIDNNSTLEADNQNLSEF